jgi:hypothetical protein
MAGTPLKNLKIFEQLCGENALGSIILTTTMWDEVEPMIGDQRERELKDEYWGPMIRQGSRVKRFMTTLDSAQEIVETLILNNKGVLTALNKSVMLLQQELVDQRKAISETAAGKALYLELAESLEKQREVLRKLTANLANSNLTKEEEHGLTNEYTQTQLKITKTVEEMGKLSLPLHRRIIQFVLHTIRALRRA